LLHVLSKIGALRSLVLDLLREHEADGALPTSARFLYYELVQRGHLSKQQTGVRRPDQNLHDALTDLRESGQVPWDWIVDESRSLDDYTGYASILEGVLALLKVIKLDPWRGKPPMILTESRSLAGVLRSLVSDYAARIASTNGQVRGFLHTRIAPELRAGDTVLYLGDYDLCGDQIEQNTRRVLEREIGGPLKWERLAITREQIDEHGLRDQIITKQDRRYKGGRPHEAVETEALKQTVLVELLRNRLDQLLLEPLERVQERANRQRRRIAAKLKNGKRGAR
jgi:hypothetical protein